MSTRAAARLALLAAAMLTAGCGAGPNGRIESLFQARTKGGPEAEALATTLLGDPAPEVRGIAAWMLAEAADTRSAVYALAPLLDDPSAEVRAAALESIEKLDPCGVPAAAVRPLLRDGEPLVRLRACSMLAACAHPAGEWTSTTAFVPLFDDPDDEVRREAILSVAAIAAADQGEGSEDRNRSVTTALGAVALQDPSGPVREAAMVALSRLTTIAEAGVFLELAESDANPLVRVQAGRSITEWRDARERAETRRREDEKKPAEDNLLPVAGEGGTGTASSR